MAKLSTHLSLLSTSCEPGLVLGTKTAQISKKVMIFISEDLRVYEQKITVPDTCRG